MKRHLLWTDSIGFYLFRGSPRSGSKAMAEAQRIVEGGNTWKVAQRKFTLCFSDWLYTVVYIFQDTFTFTVNLPGQLPSGIECGASENTVSFVLSNLETKIVDPHIFFFPIFEE